MLQLSKRQEEPPFEHPSGIGAASTQHLEIETAREDAGPARQDDDRLIVTGSIECLVDSRQHDR
jgi:hypothetical protein